MAAIKKILVPTDFSDNAQRACSVAQALADTFGSRVDLVHVIPNVKYLQENLLYIEMPLNLEEEVIPRIQEEAERQLEETMNQFLKSENRGKIHILMDRKPAERIASHAAEGGYDLVVMGATGKDESGMFRGSTTSDVIRGSRVPVLSVDHELAEGSIGSILIATDLSPLSLASFPMAALIGSAFGSKLTLFHVLEKKGYLQQEADTRRREELVSAYEEIIRRLEDFLSDSGSASTLSVVREEEPFEDMVVVKAGETDQTLQLETVIVTGGTVHDEIVNRAEEEADLLVMATHGYSGRSLFHMGSIAEKVSRQVHKPFLTIRPPEDLFRSRSQQETTIPGTLE